MDIQEAIRHCREVAAGLTEQGKCKECAAEHEQLADWLEELVAYRAAMSLGQVQELAQAEQDGRRLVRFKEKELTDYKEWSNEAQH